MARKGPGKHYRQGLSLIDLQDRFPDDATAEKWFTEQRWPDGIRCPDCNSDKITIRGKHPRMPYRCRACRKFFSVKTNSVMHSSKIGYGKWVLAIYILTTNIKGTSSMKLHRDLGIGQKAAWHMAHRIRETWTEYPVAFAGPVEIDESYIGGKEGNKHAHKRLKAGRGPVGKAAIVGAKDRRTNRIAATPRGRHGRADATGIRDRPHGRRRDRLHGRSPRLRWPAPPAAGGQAQRRRVRGRPSPHERH